MGIYFLLSVQPVTGKCFTLFLTESPLAASLLICTGETATKPSS